MDIRSGSGYPASALSNFAPHPFVIDGVECSSMEEFLQSNVGDTKEILDKLNYYVYLYADPRDDEVFYVGKGAGRRMFTHLRKSMRKNSSSKNDRINSILSSNLLPRIVIAEVGLTEAGSLSAERKLIARFGVENLTNETSGGQGVSGFASFKGKKHTAATKRKLSLSKIGSKNPMFGKKRSPEAISKFRAKMCGEAHPFWGKKRSALTRRKISRALSGCKMDANDRKKRSEGMKKVWEQRCKTGIGFPKHRKRIVTFGGQRLSLDDWEEITGVRKGTIRTRIRRGWPVGKALEFEVTK